MVGKLDEQMVERLVKQMVVMKEYWSVESLVALMVALLVERMVDQKAG